MLKLIGLQTVINEAIECVDTGEIDIQALANVLGNAEKRLIKRMEIKDRAEETKVGRRRQILAAAKTKIKEVSKPAVKARKKPGPRKGWKKKALAAVPTVEAPVIEHIDIVPPAFDIQPEQANAA